MVVKSTHLPPMWPRFDSWTWHYVWFEFVVGSDPCFKGFPPGSLVFLAPQKPAFPSSNSIRNSEGHRFVSRKTVKWNPRKIKLIYIFHF